MPHLVFPLGSSGDYSEVTVASLHFGQVSEFLRKGGSTKAGKQQKATRQSEIIWKLQDLEAMSSGQRNSAGTWAICKNLRGLKSPVGTPNLIQ